MFAGASTAIERLARISTEVDYGSEYRYRDVVANPRQLIVTISQSGETLDTLSALRLCKERRIRTLGIVNVMGSSIARECFGDDVHHHLLNMARHEWSSFQQTVTDWERVRYFERA